MNGGGQDEQDEQDGMGGEEVVLGVLSTDGAILPILPSCRCTEASRSSCHPVALPAHPVHSSKNLSGASIALVTARAGVLIECGFRFEGGRLPTFDNQVQTGHTNGRKAGWQ